METVEKLLTELIKGFVNQPDEVETYVETETDEQGEIAIIHVKVAKEDVGACIGQKGSNSEAIRKVIGLVGFKQLGKRVYVKIDAPKIPKNHFNYDTSKE